MITDLQSEGTVVRTVRLMSVLADLGGEIGVNQLAESVNLAPSTVHRLLKLLCDEGIAEWNPSTRGYAAGPGLYRLGARAVSSMSLPTLMEPYVARLAAEFNETVLFALHLPAERAMAFVLRRDGEQDLQYRIDLHQPLPLLWGASGKAILAFLDPDEVQRTCADGQASPAGGAAVPDLADLTAELATIRADGVAVTDSEKLAGARGIAAPVFDAHGVVGCFILTSPISRLPHNGIDAIAGAIKRTADEASMLLGRPAP